MAAVVQPVPCTLTVSIRGERSSVDLLAVEEDVDGVAGQVAALDQHVAGAGRCQLDGRLGHVVDVGQLAGRPAVTPPAGWA